MEDTLAFVTGILVLLSVGELAVAVISILDFRGVKIPKNVPLKEHRRRIVNIRTVIVPAVVTLMAGFLVNVSSTLFMDGDGNDGANSLSAYLYLVVAIALLIVSLSLFLRDSLDVGAIATDPASIQWASESLSADDEEAELNHCNLTMNLLDWEGKRSQYTFGKKPTTKAAIRGRSSIEKISNDLVKVNSGELPGLATALKVGGLRTLCTYLNVHRVRALLPALLAVATISATLCLAHLWGAEYSISSWRPVAFILAVIILSAVPAACIYAVAAAIAFRKIVRDSTLLCLADKALIEFKTRIDESAQGAPPAEVDSETKSLAEILDLIKRLSGRVDEVHQIAKMLLGERANNLHKPKGRPSVQNLASQIKEVFSRKS